MARAYRSGHITNDSISTDSLVALSWISALHSFETREPRRYMVNEIWPPHLATHDLLDAACDHFVHSDACRTTEKSVRFTVGECPGIITFESEPQPEGDRP
jgi:hypothetical protein